MEWVGKSYTTWKSAEKDVVICFRSKWKLEFELPIKLNLEIKLPIKLNLEIKLPTKFNLEINFLIYLNLEPKPSY